MSVETKPLRTAPLRLCLPLLLGLGCSPAEQGGDALPGAPPPGPAPQINAVSPSLTASTGGDEVTLTGTGFQRGASVRIAGLPAARISYESPTKLRVQVPALPGSLGPVALRVQNPDGGTGEAGGLLSYYAGVVDFGARVDVTVGSSPAALELALVNDDKYPDLVGVYQEQGMSVLRVALGDKSGAFGRDMEYALGREVYGLAVADIDPDLAQKDGAEVIIPNFNGAKLQVLSYQGKSLTQKAEYASGMGPIAVAVAPLGKDAPRPALLSADYIGKTLSVLVPNGQATYTLKTTALPCQPYRLAVGYLDRDGYADVVLSNSGGDSIYVLLGKGDGTFGPARAYGTGQAPTGLALADVDRDGTVDIVVVNRDEDKATVLAGRGDGTFGVRGNYVVPGQPVEVRVTDVDGDGIEDLLFGTQRQGLLQFQHGLGDGQFRPAQGFPVRSTIRALAIGDINGDRRPDVVTGNTGDYSSVLFNISR